MAIAILFLAACRIIPSGLALHAEDNLASSSSHAVSSNGSSTQFTALTPDESGIDFVHPVDISHPKKYLYVGGFASSGVAIGDLNGDGLQDIFLTGGPVKNRIYLQSGIVSPNKSKPVGNLKFRDASKESSIDGGDAWGAGATLVDIDNDGDLDVYVCNYDSPNQLFINHSSAGKIRFVESARQYGLDIVDASFCSTFCDYDLDGDLDVLVVGYQYVNPAGRPGKPPVIERDGRYFVKDAFRKYYGIVLNAHGQQTFTNVGRADYLLENKSETGKIGFVDVTKQSGISGLGVGNSAVWWDYNHDGLPDLYIGNDFKVGDQLYRNNGNGTFTDVVLQSFSHTTWFSMGSEAGDVNNDGMIDLFVSDMAGTTHYSSKVTMGEMSANRAFLKTAEPRQMMRNALMLNTGTGRFLEAAYLAGIANSDWTWAVKLADLDNDGLLDLYITNGAARMFNHSDRRITGKARVGKTQWDIWEDTENRLEDNLAFRNRGDLHFEDVSSAWGLKKTSMSYSAAYGDLDNDGDLDLVVTHLDEPVTVYRNDTNDNRAVRVKLLGTKSNRRGIGATIRIKTNVGQQVRQMMPTMGFLSCNEPIAHFGLGDATSITELTVDWPSGIHQRVENVSAGELLTIKEQGNAKRPAEPQVAKWFASSSAFPALGHTEKEFDDYLRQPLLPYIHSQLGPGLAMGDTDGDGDLDFYLGRSSGNRRAIYDNQGRAKLGVKSLAPFQTESKYEDLGSLFFDADRDGDQDLFVVSGSVECDPNDPVLADRLYINDGTGRFSKAPANAIPNYRDSGSVVCAADFDRDGDLDLFVGGRVVPGKYPVTPNSHLLVNHSIKGLPLFKEQTNMIAPTLGKTGLVTSAVWSDADNDGWIDLLVTHEWGPIKYFRNEASSKGTGRALVDRTAETGLADRFGWWNGIAARDLDNDGDIDYVATNFGHNTKYHPNDEKPELLYYGDFDGTGKPHLVEAKFENDKCVPRRGLSCSSHAMPFVRQKLKTFHNFGLASLEDIYTEQNLTQSMQLSANFLDTCVLINEGVPQGSSIPSFRIQPLPTLAQISPGFGIVLQDFDADGWVDCFLAQNFYSPQPETGRMDSGLSLLLKGQKPNEENAVSFTSVWPKESGIVIPHDAKAASSVDFNEDGWTDLLVTVNNGTLEAYEGQAHGTNRPLRVKLRGPAGNPKCIGARVVVTFDVAKQPSQTAEVAAGGGYLSQSDPTLVFGCGTAQAKQIDVRWPSGKTSTHVVKPNQLTVTISQP